MALPTKQTRDPKRRGPNWGSLIAYAIMAALALLALAPLLSALR